MTTAQPDLHRVVGRRRRRAAAPQRLRIVSLLDALENLYPQQLMHVLQALDQATRLDSPEHGEDSSDVENGDESGLFDQNIVVESVVERSDVDEEGHPEPIDSRALDLDALQPLSGERQEATSRENSFEQDGHDEDGESGEDDRNSEEEGARFEFGAWDSAGDEDDEEWEEVDDEEGEEEDDEANDNGAEGTVVEVEEEAVPEGAPDEDPEDQPSVTREHRNSLFRGRNIEGNLHRYLQSFVQTLGGQNVEVRLELPDGPFYVGNPGDYLDARGFDNFLQQSAENDNSRRGAPPAAKTAIDDLSTIQIENHHVEDGFAICSICKDVFGLGDAAKQLPCLHLYHHDCILPWLSSRNSCPMCRYELPTDDPDYEIHKQIEIRLHEAYEPPNTAEQLGGEDIFIPVQSQVADSPAAVEVSVSLPGHIITDLIPSTSSQISVEQIQQNSEALTTAENHSNRVGKE
ncbi:hypothetical protein O6H91_09G049900 [Diphasiastrum complanatum]|nr:hypothetical protein O6H91_09G049900 [Diphasiastrum complanatum]